jgi:hypothetical protein
MKKATDECRRRRMANRGGGPRITRPPAAEAYDAARVGFALATAAIMIGCTDVVGGMPRVERLDPAAGFKMLKPRATTTVCRATGLVSPSASEDLLGTALRELLARDAEATTVLNASVESTSWSLGVYGKRCVTLTGDVVRSTTTVLLPMNGVHEGHAGH